MSIYSLQALKESVEYRDGTRTPADKMGFQTAASEDDVIQDLMRASKNNHQAAELLQQMLNRGTRRKQEVMKATQEKAIQEPSKLIEEILRDTKASPEVKSQLVNDIAAKASVSSDQDETFTMLMMEAKDNPLAAQILQDMLTGHTGKD